MITHVAILWNGVLYSLPKPKRHHDVINLIHEKTGDEGIFGVQGFITDNGIFLDRVDGRNYALNTGQITTTLHARHLFSEDLW